MSAGVEPGGSGLLPVAISAGSNLEDRGANLARGVRRLGTHLRDLTCSRVYETRPLHAPDQPHFLNLVCRGRCELSARDLLGRLQRIERATGRRRSAETGRYGPRILDLDLIFYGREVIDEPGLRVPHPRVAERRFVLVPLAEVAPGWRHPESGRGAKELAAALPDQGARLYTGPLPADLSGCIEGAADESAGRRRS